MSFFKAILFSFLIIMFMEKLYAFIKARQAKTGLSNSEESTVSLVTADTVSLTDKPTKQIMAKTKKDKLSM